MEEIKIYFLSIMAILFTTGLVLFLNSDSSLTGFQTASGEQVFTASLGGVGVTEIDLKEPKELVKIEGTACFDHTGKRGSWYDRHRTGHYYRFEFAQVPASGKAEMIGGGKAVPIQIEVDPIFYPAPPNWFGGKGRGCNPVSVTFKPNTVAKKLVVKGHLVGGKPRFTANFKLTTKSTKKATQTKTPTPTTKPECRFDTDCPQPKCPGATGVCASGVCKIVGGCLTPPPLPICGQAITPAKNIKTGECREFPNTCLPGGWTAVSKCTTPTPVQQPSKEVFDFEVKNFEFYQQGTFLGDGQKPLEPDKETTIKVLMKSQSVSSPEFPLYFYIDGKEVYKKIHKLYFLKGYNYNEEIERVVLTFFPKLTEGQHTFKVAIDPEKSVPEENKNNNIYQKTISVKSKTSQTQQPTAPQQLQNSCEDSDKSNNPVIPGYLKISIKGKTSYEGDKIEGNNILESMCVSATPLQQPYSRAVKVFCPPGTKPAPVQLTVDGTTVSSAKCVQTQTQLPLSIKNLKVTQNGVQVMNNVEAGIPVRVEFFIQNDGVGDVTPTYVVKFDSAEYPDRVTTLYSSEARKGAQNVKKQIPADKISVGQHTINLNVDGTTINQNIAITVVPALSPAERNYITVFPSYTCSKEAPVGAKCLAEGKQGICRQSVELGGVQGKRCTFDNNLDGCKNYGAPCQTTAVKGYCRYAQPPKDLRLSCRAK